MSKNLTRKGLALGAVVALGSSLFAGTPATAAPTALYLASAFGTSYEGVLGQNFVLSGTAAGATTGDAVSYYIEGVTAANLTVVGRYTTDLSTTTSGNEYSNAADADGEAISLVATTKGLILKQDTDAAAKIATVKVDTWQAGAAAQIALKVNATNVTSTTTVKVTPFLDNVLADGKPGTNEYVGAPVSIVFNKASELTATPTIKAPVFGSNVAATVAVNKVNLEQFRPTTKGAPSAQDFVNVDFIEDGQAWQSNIVPAWDTTDSAFVATSADTPDASKTYGATAQFGSTDSGSASVVTASAGQVTTLGALAFSGTNFNASGLNSSSNVVRAGAGTFTASASVSAVATGKLKSGQTVTFKIKEQGANTNTLASGATVTAAGKTLTNSSTTTAQSITVDVVTDATGEAALPITYAGLADGNKFDVIAYANGASALVYAGAASSGVTLTVQDSAAAAIVDPLMSTDGDTVRHIAKLGAVSATLTVVDQFGQTPAGTYRVVVTNSGSSTGAPAITSPVAVSAGKVTVNGTDTSTAAQTYSVISTLQKQAADGSWSGSLQATSKFSTGTVPTVGSLTLSSNNTTSVVRAGKTLVAGNTDLEQGTVDHNTPTSGATLTTSAFSTTGAAAPGAAVTFSAKGVAFQAGNVWGVDSLTVNAKADGTLPSVLVYSNLVGKQTITATSGSATKTVVLTFVTPTTGGASWTVTAPANILPGQTLKVSAVLKDKFGAPVNTGAGTIKVVYTGAGYVTTTIADETDADGVVSFSVLLGAADSGTSTIKFTYGGADTIAADTSIDDVVTTSSVLIGAAPVVVSTKANVVAKTKAFSVSVSGNAAAKNVVVKVAGKTVATLKGSASAKTYTVKATKGSKKVTVYVGGKLIATKTVSVK